MSSTGRQNERRSDSAPTGRLQPADTRPGAAKGAGQAKMPPRRTWLWFVLVLVANFFLVRFLMPAAEGPVTVPYTLFKEEVGKGNVQAIYSQGDTITGRFKAPVTYPPAGEKSAAPKGEPQTTSKGGAPPRDPPKAVSSFTTTLPSFVDPGLEAFFIDHGVEISAKPIEEGGSPWATLLFGFGPALLIIGFYVWMFRRAASRAGAWGAGSWASARARPVATTRSRIRRSPSTMSPGSMKPRTSWSRSWISSGTPRSTPAWAGPLPKACCWSARRGPERPCWRRRSRERRGCRSSR